MSSLRIGSRGSRLALWQSEHIAAQLRERGHECAIEVIRTTGDDKLSVALSKVGTKGMFTKELEDALTAGEIDLAVHSLKDMPTEIPAGLAVAAVTRRADARDAFLSAGHDSIKDLPQGAHVGTSSLRRQAQLLAMRPDLRISPLRGNIDTRIKKLATGEYDAIILAAAGVERLGLDEFVRERLDVATMLPAVGQGALAIEVASSSDAAEIVRSLDHQPTRRCVTAERALLRALGGGCQVPIAAHSTIIAAEDGAENSFLGLDALVARPDGSQMIRARAVGTDPEELGSSLAEELVRRGAAKLLADVLAVEAIVPEQP